MLKRRLKHEFSQKIGQKKTFVTESLVSLATIPPLNFYPSPSLPTEG